MVHSVLLTDLFGLVQWSRAVSVRNNEYVLRREDLDGCRKRGSDDLGRFVL
jgi:hypothetical protein